MSRHYTSRPVITVQMPEYLKVALVDKSYATGIPLSIAARKLLALWVEGYVDLSPVNAVKIDDYKPQGAAQRLVKHDGPKVEFRDPLMDKRKATSEVKQLEVDGSDNSGVSQEIAGALGIGAGDTGEGAGRERRDNGRGREAVVVRKRSTGNKDGQVDCVSGPSGSATTDSGRAKEESRERPETERAAAELPSWVSKARLAKQAGPQA